MRNVFRGMIIKSWTGNNFETSEDRKHNKFIAKDSVMFYDEFYVDIFNAMHDEEEQKKILIQ